MKISPKSKKNLLLTFDYELFLGIKSGSVDRCMIEPTDALIHILDKYALKSIFFVDATYLHFLREEGKKHEAAQRDFEKIKKQLQEMVLKGHHLYLHIHPHWKDAQYHPDINQWSHVKKSHFSFENLNTEERDYIFKTSFSVLQDIASINPDHIIEGFRAGGLYIQPFDIFIPYFKKYNISCDFSVLSGFSSKGENYGYDFSKINYKDIYLFEQDVTMPTHEGSFIEFPISVIEAGIQTKVLNSLWHRLYLKYKKNDVWGDGIPTQNKLISKPSTPKYTLKESASIEMMNLVKVNTYVRYFRNHNFMQMISHPKFLSPMHLKAFEKFIQRLQKRYTIQTEIDTILRQAILSHKE